MILFVPYLMRMGWLGLDCIEEIEDSANAKATEENIVESHSHQRVGCVNGDW